jgi:hypothetical protein
MNYQPNLYVFNAEDASSRSIYQVIKYLGFGKISHVERDNSGAYVAMDQWNMKITTSTRMKLQQGKPLLLYYSEDKFWKVYAYEHRFAEEEHKKRIEKKRAIQLKRRAAAIDKERHEKEASMRRERKERERKERERKERERKEREHKEREDQLCIEREIDEMLESFKQASINEDQYRQTFDVDAADDKFVKVFLDYGNTVEMYPVIKARAKKMFDRLKNKNKC